MERYTKTAQSILSIAILLRKTQICDNTLLLRNDFQLCVHHVLTKGILNLHEMEQNVRKIKRTYVVSVF